MAFCLGTLLRIVKKYEIDQLKTNEVFVNELLGCFVGGYAGLDKTVVSKILNCKCNAPDFLKQHLKDLNFNAKLSEKLYHYVEENLHKGCFDELSSGVLDLCSKDNKIQSTIFAKLTTTTDDSVNDKSLDNDSLKLSKFLAVALIEAVQITNIIETDRVISQRGNSILCHHSGDIFKFAFNRKSKSKNIVVIPVNTRFDIHISRKFEGDVRQEVSINTIHGQWFDRMIKRSGLKEKVDNSYDLQNENKIKTRINKDLETRGVKADENGEFPLGSVSVLQEDSTIFYLLATSKFDENNNAHASKEDVRTVFKSLVHFYDQNGQGLDIYLPLIGTGMSRAGFSNQESFGAICEAFDPVKSSFVGKVTIVALPDVYENLPLEE